MPELKRVIDPDVIGTLSLTATRGVTAGWTAGIAQVVAAQVVGLLLGRRERADIAPRFIRQAARHAGSSLSTPMQWLIGTIFHFEYAASWGASYGLIVEALGPRRVPRLLGAGVLAAAIYSAAFSPIGAGTRTGAERDVEHRPPAEHVVQWASAVSFALVAAFAYRWLRERW